MLLAVSFALVILVLATAVIGWFIDTRVDAVEVRMWRSTISSSATAAVERAVADRRAADDRLRVAAELQLCRQRTESLRRVLEVLIPSGIWPERVRLPDPPPGWAPWPDPGDRDRATSTTTKDR